MSPFVASIPGVTRTGEVTVEDRQQFDWNIGQLACDDQRFVARGN
jgi:hypothetical protein